MLVNLQGVWRPEDDAVRLQLFRLRHKVFVEGRKWSLPSRNDLDIDQYDCPQAAYFCEIDDDGAVQSHVRLTPTVTHSLMADYFPHLVSDRFTPRDPRIYEATRYIVQPSKKSRQSNRQAKARLLVAMLEWAETKGLSHIQTVIDTATYASFVEMTEATIPLGLSYGYGGGPNTPGGGECMGIRWPVTDRVIHDVRSYGGLQCQGCAECDQQDLSCASEPQHRDAAPELLS
jgi:N-acyl-L-homoserine lactone synthetase